MCLSSVVAWPLLGVTGALRLFAPPPLGVGSCSNWGCWLARAAAADGGGVLRLIRSSCGSKDQEVAHRASQGGK